jgi:hypothetical protein
VFAAIVRQPGEQCDVPPGQLIDGSPMCTARVCTTDCRITTSCDQCSGIDDPNSGCAQFTGVDRDNFRTLALAPTSPAPTTDTTRSNRSAFYPLRCFCDNEDAANLRSARRRWRLQRRGRGRRENVRSSQIVPQLQSTGSSVVSVAMSATSRRFACQAMTLRAALAESRQLLWATRNTALAATTRSPICRQPGLPPRAARELPQRVHEGLDRRSASPDITNISTSFATAFWSRAPRDLFIRFDDTYLHWDGAAWNELPNAPWGASPGARTHFPRFIHRPTICGSRDWIPVRTSASSRMAVSCV